VLAAQLGAGYTLRRRSTAQVASTRRSAGVGFCSATCSIAPGHCRGAARARRVAHRLPLELRHRRGTDFLLATGVGDEPLAHEHGAPVRLVAPGRRGFQWVKWVVELQLDEEPDHGPGGHDLSSFTRAGRGQI